jgi:acyl-CoA thioesterase
MDDGDAIARRAATAMYERDRASKTLGIEVIEVRPGFGKVAFTVREDMLNGHDVCHGGFLFTLADTAFAYACNSRNDINLALQCSISFASSARRDERLTATAQERALGGRTGTYDCEVLRDDGSVVALFRGTSYRVKGNVV